MFSQGVFDQGGCMPPERHCKTRCSANKKKHLKFENLHPCGFAKKPSRVVAGSLYHERYVNDLNHPYASQYSRQASKYEAIIQLASCSTCQCFRHRSELGRQKQPGT